MASKIKGILGDFHPVTLAGMDCVKLMTRWDKKYICPIGKLPGILDSARPEWQVLEILDKRLFGYASLYLDTPDHQMYLMHHNRKLNRYKIRIREYQETHEFFFEIKFKDNHQLTIKKRIGIGPDGNYHTEEVREFLSANSTFEPEMLEPKVSSLFKRMTLVNSDIRERVTIDILPEWFFGNRRISMPGIVVIEVKSARSSTASGFALLLREARVFPRRLSKYCTGTALLYPEIKHNRFKAKLLHLNTIEKSNKP